MDIDDVEMDDDYLLGLDTKSEDMAPGDSPKLRLALKKRQIVQEERGRLHKVVQGIRMQKTDKKEKTPGVQIAQVKLIEDDPFVKFYLEIYRDLCGKININEITKEVFGRWKNMRRKPRTTLRKIHTDPHVTFGLAWDMAFGEKHSNGTANQLKFALMKNKIVSEEMARLVNFVKNMYKEKKCSVTFLKTYLKVYREMCGKSSVGEIRGEAMKRYIKKKECKTSSKAELKAKNRSKKAFRSEAFGKWGKPGGFTPHSIAEKMHRCNGQHHEHHHGNHHGHGNGHQHGFWHGDRNAERCGVPNARSMCQRSSAASICL